MSKIQNCRLVLQQCSECGELFPLLYLFDDAQLTSFGSVCKHIQDGANFYPIAGQPTFDAWYQEQLKLRSYPAYGLA